LRKYKTTRYNKFKEKIVKIKILILVVCFVTNTFLLACNDVSKETVEQKNKNGTVSIEAALVYKSGDVKPVARTEFMLLDKSLEEILKESGFVSSINEVVSNNNKGAVQIGNIPLVSLFGVILQTSEDKDRGVNEEQRKIRKDLRTALQTALAGVPKHTVYSTKTDFQGKAEIQNVKPGEYYLFGTTEPGVNARVWNVKTLVKEGQNSVLLDQDNTSEKPPS
jgi:hypothetical protein